MHTGMFQFPRPSMGAWALYGLGTENENLPGFVTISPPRATTAARRTTAARFLPAIYQGTRIGASVRPIATASVSNISNPKQSPDGPARAARLRPVAEPRDLERDPHNPGVEG